MSMTLPRTALRGPGKLGMTLGVHGVGMNGGVRIPFRDIADSGIIFGLGTDATIVSHYQPFITLGWAGQWY